MRYILLILAVWYSSINLTYSQTDCLKFELIDFLKETKDIPDDIDSTEIVNSLFVISLDNPRIRFSDEPGIYKFGTLTSHSSLHLLIAQDMKYKLVNMNESLDSIILSIVEYYDADQSQYTVKDLSTSIKNVITLYKKNLDAVPWKIEKE